jgi:hypothetical protein
MRKKEQERERIPYVPCGRCMSGFVLVEQDGRRAMARCSCWLAWNRKMHPLPQTPESGKERAGGQ